MPLRSCPICRKQFDLATTTAPPFCSDRCRRIDLGRWLNEQHAVPHVRMPDDEDDGEEMRLPRDDDES
jgi:endogenous inhibitor of DNA gyrase (YacG/DUF329 family)